MCIANFNPDVLRAHGFLNRVLYGLLPESTRNLCAMPVFEFEGFNEPSKGTLLVNMLVTLFPALANSAGRLVGESYACVAGVFPAAAMPADCECLDFAVRDGDAEEKLPGLCLSSHEKNFRLQSTCSQRDARSN